MVAREGADEGQVGLERHLLEGSGLNGAPLHLENDSVSVWVRFLLAAGVVGVRVGSVGGLLRGGWLLGSWLAGFIYGASLLSVRLFVLVIPASAFSLVLSCCRRVRTFVLMKFVFLFSFCAISFCVFPAGEISKKQFEATFVSLLGAQLRFTAQVRLVVSSPVCTWWVFWWSRRQ